MPTVYLLHPLNVLSSDTTTFVYPDEASEMSIASGENLSVSTAGRENTFLLHTRDANDNPRWTETTSELSGFVLVCLGGQMLQTLGGRRTLVL